MSTTTIAPGGATQRSFTGAGFLQIVPVIPPLRCGGCKASPLPPAYRVCPVCGWARPGQEGAPYPSKSVERYGWVFDQRIENPTDRHVLLALVWHDMPGGRGVFPTIDRLADKTRLDRATVKRALARLRKAGWIVRHKTRHRGRQGSNFYVIQQPECVLAAMAVDDAPPFPEAHSAPLPEAHGAPLRSKG